MPIEGVDSNGIVKPVRVDTNGNIILSGTSSGASVKITDGTDTAAVAPSTEMESGEAALRTETEVSASVPIMTGGSSDGTMDSTHFKPQLVDDDGTVTQTNVEYKMHRGGVYVVNSGKQSLAASSTDYILFHTPASSPMHLTSWILIVNKDAEMYLYEEPSASGGTPITPLNKNRDSSNTASSTFALSPTVTTEGTLLDSVFWDTAAAINQTSLSTAGSDEWHLKPDTDYLIKIVNNDSSNAMDWQIKLIFMED